MSIARRERYVQCGDCEDRFKIVYDSNKKTQDAYSCKCGKLICYPDYFGSFSYDKNSSVHKLSYEEQCCKTEMYENDYIKLSKSELDLINDIRELGKHTPLNYEERIDEDGIDISMSDSNSYDENLVIGFSVRLRSYGNGWTEEEIFETHKRILEGLSRFKNIAIKVVNGEICLNKPKQVYDDSSLEFYDGHRRQHERYDYELNC